MKAATRNIKVEQILTIAETVFLEYGYDKTSILTITVKANINTAMLHYYFKNKENLFNEVIIRRLENLKHFKFEKLDVKNPINQLLMIIERQIYLIQNHHAFYKMMLIELLKNDNKIVVKHINSYIAHIESQIFEILEIELYRIFKIIDKDVIAQNIMGLLIHALVVKNTQNAIEKTKDTLMRYYRNYFLDLLMLHIET
jgi:AcrR family transcriptional regulator